MSESNSIETTTKRDRWPSEYVAWANMKQRCLRTTHKSYHNYGGRGITVCERWMSFENFIADMGPKPAKEMTLERKDNAIGYEPENCVWDTRKAQSNNMRANRLITHDGITMTVSQWADKLGFERHVLSSRLERGLSGEALFAAMQETPTYTFDRRTMTLKDWCKEFGVNPHTACVRMNRGWSFAESIAAVAKDNGCHRLIEIDGERNSIAEWTRRKGLPHGIISTRLSKGWSERYAVLTPVKTAWFRGKKKILDDIKELELVTRYRAGGVTQGQLALEFGISTSLANTIIARHNERNSLP